METKFCHRCRRLLSVTSFRKNRSRKCGLTADCRECRSAYERAYRKLPGKGTYERIKAKKEADPVYREERKVYERERQKRSLATNPAYHRRQLENAKRHFRQQRANNPVIRAADQARSKAAKLKYPERVKARTQVYGALRNGTLIKLPCKVCDSPRSHAHHQDYNKPLDVEWLCAKCHGMEHRRF